MKNLEELLLTLSESRQLEIKAWIDPNEIADRLKFIRKNRKTPSFSYGDRQVSSRSDAYEGEALEKDQSTAFTH